MQDENINLIKLTAMLDKLSFLHKHEKKSTQHYRFII